MDGPAYLEREHLSRKNPCKIDFLEDAPPDIAFLDYADPSVTNVRK